MATALITLTIGLPKTHAIERRVDYVTELYYELKQLK